MKSSVQAGASSFPHTPFCKLLLLSTPRASNLSVSNAENPGKNKQENVLCESDNHIVGIFASFRIPLDNVERGVFVRELRS